MDKRTFNAVLEKYKREKIIKDIYVEGEDDRGFYKQHGEETNKQFIDISSIDFSEEKEKIIAQGYETGNRDKVIYLINSLKENKIENVRGIIDKDILPYTRGLPKNSYVWTTDYSCLEMYFFTDECIKKVQNNSIKKITKDIVENIMKMLQQISAIRIIEKNMNLSLKKPDICSYVTIKKDNSLFLDSKNYMNELEKQNSKYKDKMKVFKQSVNECLKELSKDNIRNIINGHELIAVLTCYLKKIDKKNYQHISDCFLTGYYKNAVETENIKDYTLFKKIANF